MQHFKVRYRTTFAQRCIWEGSEGTPGFWSSWDEKFIHANSLQEARKMFEAWTEVEFGWIPGDGVKSGERIVDAIIELG